MHHRWPFDRQHFARLRISGFTLIEVMIVVAVIAILAAVAMPAYFDSVRKSRRADAITLLNQVAQEQERWRANNSTFSPNLGSGGLRVTPSATAVTTAGTVSSSQINGPSGHYRISVSTDSALIAGVRIDQTRHDAVATAIGAQVADAKCTTLTFTMNSGTVTYGSTGTATPAKCWNR